MQAIDAARTAFVPEGLSDDLEIVANATPNNTPAASQTITQSTPPPPLYPYFQHTSKSCTTASIATTKQPPATCRLYLCVLAVSPQGGLDGQKQNIFYAARPLVHSGDICFSPAALQKDFNQRANATRPRNGCLPHPNALCATCPLPMQNAQNLHGG